MIKTLKQIASKDAREEDRRNKKLIEELHNSTSIKEYNVKGGESYKVRLLEPVVSPRSAAKSAIEFIIERNTEKIEYKPKDQDEDYLIFSSSKKVTYVPKRRDINIKSTTLVNVPRWDLTFEAFDRTYSRDIFAYSGIHLEDTLRYCPKHTAPFKKENVAFCEVCGQVFCNQHVFQCPTCGKWLCEDHGTFCQNCRRIFCQDHITLTCEICNQPLCSDCKVICPLCSKLHGQKHKVTCSQCGKEVCLDCMTVTGILRKKRICKKCL